MDLAKLDAAPGPRITVQTSIPRALSVPLSLNESELPCASPNPSLHSSPSNASDQVSSNEKMSLLSSDDIEGDAAFAGIPELRRSSTPVKSRWSYFQRVLWLDLPDDDWEDEAILSDQFDPVPEGTAPEGTRTGGVNIRCICLLGMLMTVSLAAVGSCLVLRYVPVLSKLWLWFALNLIGFAYVSKVTERRPWFVSRFGNYSEIAKVLALAPVIFFLGPIHTIRSPAHRLDFDAVRDFGVYNGLYYVVPFFLGVNWTHLQRWKPLRGISASPAGIKQLFNNPRAGMVVTAALPGVLGALGYHAYLIGYSQNRWVYAAYAGGLVGSIALVTWLVRKSKSIHLHHFFSTCVMIPFTSFNNPISAVCQSLLAGVYIEGAARFGMGYFIDQWSDKELGYRTEWSWCCIPLH